MPMCSPIFRWKLVPSPPPRTDSQETYFEGAEEVNLGEPITQQGHASVSQASPASNEPPSQSLASPSTPAREDFPKSLDATPSNFDFGSPADLAGKSKLPDNREDFELLSQDLGSQEHMIFDSEDVIPNSQPECLNRINFEKRDENDCKPPVRAESDVSTGISNPNYNANGTGTVTQATTNHSALVQEEQSSNRDSNAIFVDEGNSESLIPRTDSNVDLQQDLVELMEDFPAQSVFSVADFEDFLRALNSPPRNTDNASDPSSIAGLESTLTQLRLSSASEGSSIPVASSSEESNQEGSKRLKRTLSSPNHEEAKKRRTSGMKTPRPMGKPAKLKKNLKLTPPHPMTLRTKAIRSEETPKRSVLVPVAEESPIRKRGRKPGKKIQVEPLEQEERKRNRADSDPEYIAPSYALKKDPRSNSNKSTDGKAPSLNGSGKTRAGRKILGESQNLFVEEPTIEKTRTRRGRKKTPVSYSEPFLDDYREPDNKTRKYTKKNPKKGNSQPIDLIPTGTPRRTRKTSTSGAFQVSIGRESPTAAEVNQVGAYLRSARTKLLAAVFEETTVPEQDCEQIRREVKERAERLLRWSQSAIEDGKIRYQVEDLIVLCESLQRQINSLIDNASQGTPTVESEYSNSQNDNFLVPGTPPSQRRRPPEHKTRTEVRVVAKKNCVRGTDGLGRGRNQGYLSTQSKNPRGTPTVSPRAANSGTQPPPVVFNSNPLDKFTLAVLNTSSPVAEELRLTGRTPLSTCAHPCGCEPKSLKTFADQATNTDFAEPLKPKSVDVSTQTDVREFKKSKVLVDSATNTDLFYSVNWDESSDDDRKVPDIDDKENVDPICDLSKITGIFLPRESEWNAPRPYDHLLPEIMSNPDFVPPQEYLDDMRWDSSSSSD